MNGNDWIFKSAPLFRQILVLPSSSHLSRWRQDELRQQPSHTNFTGDTALDFFNFLAQGFYSFRNDKLSYCVLVNWGLPNGVVLVNLSLHSNMK